MEKFKSGEYYFVAFIGADYNNWLRNYKITRITVFAKSELELNTHGIYERLWEQGKRLSKSDKCKHWEEGSKFWPFCDNSIIECPQTICLTYHFIDKSFSK